MSEMEDVKPPEAATAPWPEDTVEYRVYCSRDVWQDDASLSRLAVECNFACRQLSGSHVWHYSAFALRPITKGRQDRMGYLIVFIWLVAGLGAFSWQRRGVFAPSQMSVDCML